MLIKKSKHQELYCKAIAAFGPEFGKVVKGLSIVLAPRLTILFQKSGQSSQLFSALVTALGSLEKSYCTTVVMLLL